MKKYFLIILLFASCNETKTSDVDAHNNNQVIIHGYLNKNIQIIEGYNYDEMSYNGILYKNKHAKFDLSNLTYTIIFSDNFGNNLCQIKSEISNATYLRLKKIIDTTQVCSNSYPKSCEYSTFVPVVFYYFQSASGYELTASNLGSADECTSKLFACDVNTSESIDQVIASSIQNDISLCQ